ncbi:MAG TPA: 50S ribosomal protein L11 methyltransferase, partial [Pyrinomonadaceae bacterium]
MLDPAELFPEVPNLYEFPSIHSDMIYDEHRVGAYRQAIERTVKEGDVVVDVGTGTGILAFLCLKAGAARVHAIDRSPVINWARRLAETNGMADQIIFHQCDSRDVNLGEQA